MNNYYVYEWYIVPTNEVFYVGKGNDNRVTSLKSRSKLFLKIRQLLECDYKKVYTDLSEDDALRLEARQMLIRTLEGNHLVNINTEYDDYYFEDLDDQYLDYCDAESAKYDEELKNYKLMENRLFSPYVHVNELEAHYFGIPSDAVFDDIEDDIPEVYLHQRVTAQRNNRIQEEVAYLKSDKSKAIVRSKNKAKYIVEFEIPSYEEIIEFRSAGYKIIHSIELIKYLNDGESLKYRNGIKK